MAMSMRKVVRAAYSGRLAGSSDTGWRVSSVKGSNRCRLASARNTKSPRVIRTASASQRLNKRAHPPAEIGTITRIGDARVLSLRHAIVTKFVASIASPAASLARSHNIRVASGKHYYEAKSAAAPSRATGIPVCRDPVLFLRAGFASRVGGSMLRSSAPWR